MPASPMATGRAAENQAQNVIIIMAELPRRLNVQPWQVASAKVGVRTELEVFGGSTENSELPGFPSSPGPAEVSASPFLDLVQRPCPRLLPCRVGLTL